jgi:Trk K+ transport system NAD-binding subunit
MADQVSARKTVVLGAGMVGSAIAVDLSRDYQVTAVDIDRARVVSKICAAGE